MLGNLNHFHQVWVQFNHRSSADPVLSPAQLAATLWLSWCSALTSCAPASTSPTAAISPPRHAWIQPSWVPSALFPQRDGPADTQIAPQPLPDSGLAAVTHIFFFLACFPLTGMYRRMQAQKMFFASPSFHLVPCEEVIAVSFSFIQCFYLALEGRRKELRGSQLRPGSSQLLSEGAEINLA